jgi:hypothetical protein
LVIPNPPIWNGAIYLRSRRYGDVEQLRSGHIVLSIGNERLNLQAPHTQTLDKDQVVKLRHLFRTAGVTPEHPELETGEKPAATLHGAIVTIDHRDILRLKKGGGLQSPARVPEDPSHYKRIIRSFRIRWPPS